jgi:hypothetical protein
MLHTGFRDGLFCWAYGNSHQMMRNLKKKRKKEKTQKIEFSWENDEGDLREQPTRNLTVCVEYAGNFCRGNLILSKHCQKILFIPSQIFGFASFVREIFGLETRKRASRNKVTVSGHDRIFQAIPR